MGLDPDDSPDDNFPTNEIALELCNCDIWTFSWRSTRLIMRYHAQATLSERVRQSLICHGQEASLSFSSGRSERIHMEHPESVYVFNLLISSSVSSSVDA